MNFEQYCDECFYKEQRCNSSSKSTCKMHHRKIKSLEEEIISLKNSHHIEKETLIGRIEKMKNPMNCKFCFYGTCRNEECELEECGYACRLWELEENKVEEFKIKPLFK